MTVNDDQLVVGRHAVQEFLEQSPHNAVELVVASGVKPQSIGKMLDLAKKHGIKVRYAGRKQLDQLASDGAVHQGLVLRTSGGAAYTDWQDFCDIVQQQGREALVVVADHVQDPHNLGAIIRSSAAAGACGVVIPKDRACQLTPAVMKASAGTTSRIAVCRVANLGQAVDELKKMGLWAAAAATRGGESPWDMDLTGPLALVVGGEHKGVSQKMAERCDYLATFPLAPGVESLNASVAAAVLLFEVVRQRAGTAAS